MFVEVIQIYTFVRVCVYAAYSFLFETGTWRRRRRSM
jgi:hypothetical protein